MFSFKTLFFVLIFIVLLVLNLCIDTINITFLSFLSIFYQGTTGNADFDILLLEFRLPRVLGAIAAGASLAVAGVLMQTWFRNILAEPSILGITAGGSLGVAVLTLGSGWGIWVSWDLLGSIGISIASIIGAALVLGILSLFYLYFRQGNLLLLVGILLGQLIMAIVGIWQYFSHPEKVQEYLRWTMGSLDGLTLMQSFTLLILAFVGVIGSFIKSKMLNIWYLGDDYAQSLGYATRKDKMLILLLVSCLAGGVTAFCGPIGFVGIMVPHLIRYFYQTAQHQILLPYSAFLGSILLLFCGGISHWINISLPINAITAILGIPISLWILINKK
ncbi:MAG: iron ABC transporter permease [Bacteroidetes bacterium]|nr:MAG: iron ABC transporter permease [Bacteroidota bacterium]